MRLEELQKKLRTLSVSMPPAIEEGMWKAVLNIEQKAKENCPVKTGATRRSISSEVGFRGNQCTGVVGAGTNYSIYIHEGTSKMQARPFLLDAIKEKEEETVEFLSKSIEKELQRHRT